MLTAGKFNTAKWHRLNNFKRKHIFSRLNSHWILSFGWYLFEDMCMLTSNQPASGDFKHIQSYFTMSPHFIQADFFLSFINEMLFQSWPFDAPVYYSIQTHMFLYYRIISTSANYFLFFLNKFPDKHVHVVGNYTNYSTSMECFHWRMEENLLLLLFHRMNINFGWLFFLYVHIVCNLMKTKQQHVHKLGKKGYKFELCAK